MRPVRGVRSRLTVTLVALVALTAGVLGLGSYAFVDASLHDRFLRDRADQARFDLAVLAPAVLRPGASQADVESSGLLETFGQRGVEDTIVDTRDDPRPELLALVPTLRAVVGRGELGFEWLTIGGAPKLVVGGSMSPEGPDFYFVHDATELETVLGQLRLTLGVGAVVLAVLALLAARRVARGVLAPVEEAGRAAERIERGDLSVRVPVASRDEFGAWAERFNRMAAALEETIGRLQRSQAQNRRFVADVSHELRTPLTAIVAEASILGDQLEALPPGARRAAELLIGDVSRLRALVEDLMELSRFDAEAEQVTLEPVDLVALVRSVVAARLPEAKVDVGPDRLAVATEPRRFERILGNLLDNARQHAPGSAVEVSVQRGPDDIVVEVADRGPGIPTHQLAHIFDRFFKADPSRHDGSSGLGLAIAAEHAALLGGGLRAWPREGGGLRIELRLPVTTLLPGGDEAAKHGIDAEAPIQSTQEPIR